MTAFSPFIPHERPRQRHAGRDVRVRDRQQHRRRARPTRSPARSGTTAPTAASHTLRARGRHRQPASSPRPTRTCSRPTAATSPSPPTRADVEHVDHHFRGQWFDNLAVFWKEFARPGPLPRAALRHPAHLAAHEPAARARHARRPRHRRPPARRASSASSISWSFPRGRHLLGLPQQPRRADPRPADPDLAQLVRHRNGPTALASAREALDRWDDLKAADPRLPRRPLRLDPARPRSSTPPAPRSALLRTATVIRLEGGEIWAWEGQHTQDGSCEGSCTHVWNYQQALSHLFPALERTLRETEFAYNQLPTGGLTFRQKLPLGSGFDVIGPCADGHFGAIVKTCRDWKLSGDTDWLRRALAERPARDGIRLEPGEPRPLGPGGDRHPLRPPAPDPRHGALRAQLLARLDVRRRAPRRRPRWPPPWARPTSPTRRAAHGRAGAAYIDAELFNGRWFVQKIDLSDKAVLAPFDTGRKAGVLADGFMETYWSDEFGELKYQMGEGCISDQILGQWHAEVAGLGGFLDAGQGPDRAEVRARQQLPPRPLATISTPAATTPSRTRAACSSPPTPRASASRWSPPPTPRRSGPASSTCPPRT